LGSIFRSPSELIFFIIFNIINENILIERKAALEEIVKRFEKLATGKFGNDKELGVTTLEKKNKRVHKKYLREGRSGTKRYRYVLSNPSLSQEIKFSLVKLMIRLPQ
jgi:hypothetical protein